MLLSILLSWMALSETPDTLSAAAVYAERAVTVSRTDTVSIPDYETPAVGDVLLRTPGLVLSDNGGAAGLKTVSLRGLGSPHTTIRIDGIKVSNVQSGQGDLGMLDMTNLGGMVVDYAQNSVDFCTSRPSFDYGRKVGGKVMMGAGSFGTYLPQARLDFKLSDRVSLSANASGTISGGNFVYGDGLRRENNDIKQYRAGLDAFGLMSGGDWSAKAYVGGAGRGTPGSVDWPSTDRQKDLSGFVQGRVRKNFGSLYSMDLSGKVSYDGTDYFSSYGDSSYGQTAVLIGSGNRFHPLKWLDLSLTLDFEWGGLRATYYEASRIAATAAAGASFVLPRFKADLTLEYDGTFDKGGLSSNVLSPAADFRWEVGGGVALGGFARRAYRAPTFNELYYPGYGNPSLRPEDALLTDLGIEYHKATGEQWTISAKADGFFNFLKDKITSAPSPEDPNIWMPYNIETVKAYGLDAETGFMYMDKDWKAAFSARYSYQEADGVPYLSRHSVVLSGELTFRGWSLVPVWNYRGGRHDSYGDMPDWNTLDLTFSKSIRFKACGPLTLAVTARNLADTRYALVSGYPCPSRSFIATLSFRF
ncbi:MAG: TonB-dependent receptor [Bacteroidales bacterium]|nr:TonB-dependent receptor [Bacteroidales bacterium]